MRIALLRLAALVGVATAPVVTLASVASTAPAAAATSSSHAVADFPCVDVSGSDPYYDVEVCPPIY